MSEKQELRIRVANLQAENTDLRAKLEAAEKDLIAIGIINANLQNSYENCKQDYFKAEQERDNLQAVNGVLRGALEKMTIQIGVYGLASGLDYKVANNMRDIVINALTTTPAEAGELTEIIDTAKLYIGVPFVWGGASPSGFDCSGFTQYVMKENGITIPRTVAEQYQCGTLVSKDNLKPGDLIFFATYEDGATHGGLYIGGDKFIHASLIPEPGQVAISLLSEPYYAERYIGARRYIKICSEMGLKTKLAQQVISTSTEAAERVQGLVDTLEECRETVQYVDKGISRMGGMPKFEPLMDKISDALAKYRGGADGE